MKHALWAGISLLAGSLLILTVPWGFSQDENERRTRLEDLGRALFFDVNLSRDRTQSCATCHDPAQAFVDWRDNGVDGAASLGGDGRSLGDRNSPTASYAAIAPDFHLGEDGEYIGGQFWDGRARNLEDQAGQPFLNPVEMAMSGVPDLVERLRESPIYQRPFTNLFGEDVFEDAESIYEGLKLALATFERSEFFSPFDSKYDRYLRGEYEPTREEELGITLFFSQQFTNCNQCHQLNPRAAMERETFTNYKYHNIGVPVNETLRQANGLGQGKVDRGLLENPGIDDPAQSGKFKVSTLRNVAITGPYMHNGVFQDLRTVMLFYNKFNARSPQSQINPETGESWGEPEVSENISLEELQSAPALDDQRIDALVAFMKMLTDRRYEILLE